MNSTIKHKREELGLKQVDLAKKLGITQATLSNWERGEYEPDNESLQKLSSYLGVSTDYLLTGNIHGVRMVEKWNHKDFQEDWEAARTDVDKRSVLKLHGCPKSLMGEYKRLFESEKIPPAEAEGIRMTTGGIIQTVSEIMVRLTPENQKKLLEQAELLSQVQEFAPK